MANGAGLPSPDEDGRGAAGRGPGGTRPSLRRSDSRKMPPSLAVRKRVGGYVVGETVGEGSFGKVRMGVHSLTEERVAMKILDKKLIAKREYVRKNLRREAAVLQRLASGHPNIIRLYEVLETANNYYLVTEYAEGGPFMRHLCDRKRLSERETRKYMRQLVSAVDYMHQADVVHRDIKIENFLLDEDSNLKVIDFGLSNVLGPDCLLKTQCGSPAYAAPEIFCNSSYGPAVDVWSIGVNMFAMLTGELPFTVDPPTNMTKLHAKIVQGCTIPQHLTRDCKDLLGKLLTASETERISLRDVMRHPWINRGYTRRLFPAQFPNRLADEHLDADVIASLVAGGFDEVTVRQAVTQNKPVAETAGYHLLRSRLDKGWGYPDGRSPAATTAHGIDGNDDIQDVIDLESDSVIFTPVPATAAAARASRPGSRTGSRRGTDRKRPERHESAKSHHRLADKQRTIEQETRLKSTPAPTKKLSGPIMVDARKPKSETAEEVPPPPPTREIILEDMRKKLALPLESDLNNNDMDGRDNKGPLIIITSLDENSTSADKLNPSSSSAAKTASSEEVRQDPDKENDRSGLSETAAGARGGRDSPTGTTEPRTATQAGRKAPTPGRAAVERGCMIIVNGKLTRGSLLSDALQQQQQQQQQQRSAWTADSTTEEGGTAAPRRLGLRRSRTDPGRNRSSAATQRGGDDAGRDRFAPPRQPRNGSAHSPYQNHSALPAHRLGLYYSVTRHLRHYPGTTHQFHNQRELDHTGAIGQPARARSHTAPNGRPLLGLKGAQVRSAPQALMAPAARARAASGKDLTLPRIHVGGVGRH